uniref:(northern house mosquito) hypothetical protein n=1 Tax=Culex pipiens TaxID=7175 RepID=A0A8D8FFE1_CULPI
MQQRGSQNVPTKLATLPGELVVFVVVPPGPVGDGLANFSVVVELLQEVDQGDEVSLAGPERGAIAYLSEEVEMVVGWFFVDHGEEKVSNDVVVVKERCECFDAGKIR